MPVDNQGAFGPFQSHLSQSESCDQSRDSTRKISISFPIERPMLPSSPHALWSDDSSPMTHCSTLEKTLAFDLRPRLPPLDYEARARQFKTPSNVLFLSISESHTWTAQLIRSRKRAGILDFCQGARTLQDSTHLHTSSNSAKNSTFFTHAAWTKPPGFLEREKEVKQRHSWKNLQKTLLNGNDVSVVFESSVHLFLSQVS